MCSKGLYFADVEKYSREELYKYKFDRPKSENNPVLKVDKNNNHI